MGSRNSGDGGSVRGVRGRGRGGVRVMREEYIYVCSMGEAASSAVGNV